MGKITQYINILTREDFPSKQEWDFTFSHVASTEKLRTTIAKYRKQQRKQKKHKLQ